MTEYPIAEETVGAPVKIILILLCLVVLMVFFANLLGIKIVRILCSAILFWFPLSGLAQAATQGCAAIPI